MSWQSNPAMIWVRAFLRGVGLTRPIAWLLGGRGYEAAFDAALFSTIGEGDIVWDVGANVGYYTRRFAEVVGPSGFVVAFEPFPDTADVLRSNLQGVENSELKTLALGASEGQVHMLFGEDELGATNRISDDAKEGVSVTIARGDDLIDSESVKFPSALKIDTEGFELDVLRGMPQALESPKLRAVFIEVHFGLLARRGQQYAAQEIEKMLVASGFDVDWVDPSHIAARRSN